MSQLTRKANWTGRLKRHRRVCVCVLLTVSIFIAYKITSWRNESHIFKLARFGQKTLGNQKQAEPSTPDLTNRCTDPSKLVSPVGWEWLSPYHVAYPHNYCFIMDQPGACKTKSPFLVLIVPVAPHNLAARDAIRRTWGNETLVLGQRVLTLFLLGLPGGSDAQQQLENVRQESRTHGDLIQSDFTDSYNNLTIKTMVMLDWLASRCPGASYAMKIDSDMFLNVQNLVKMLQTPNIPHENYLTGMLMWNRPVVRDPASKWYVPEEAYPNLTYPTYTLGMGYVFSNDLAGKLVEVSKDVQPFNIEDAYVGACLKKLGYGPISPPDPSQWKAYLQGYNRCEFSSVITYILPGSKELVEYWTDLHRPEPPCNTELKEGN